MGKKYNLTCNVSDVAPIRNVTVTFLRGGEKLHQETFEEHSNATASDLVVTHNLIARRADHGAEFSCEAALDLRPHGELFEKASHNQSLRTVGEFSFTCASVAPFKKKCNKTNGVHELNFCLVL